MDNLSQQLREAVGYSGPPLRPPALARARAERGRRQRRIAAAAGVAAAAAVAVSLTVQLPQRNALPATTLPPTATTSAPTTSAALSPAVSPALTTLADLTTTTTTTPTTVGSTSPPADAGKSRALGALDPPTSAPAGYVRRPWTDETLSFGLLNSRSGELYCIAPATFVREGSDYEIRRGKGEATCYRVDAETAVFGRYLFTQGGAAERVQQLSAEALAAAFEGTFGDALWPVWYAAAENDGAAEGGAGGRLRYLSEQYDPEDRRLTSG